MLPSASSIVTELQIDAAKPNIARVASGSFTGTGADNYAVAHGLVGTPSIQFQSVGSGVTKLGGFVIYGTSLHSIDQNASVFHNPVTAADATNIYISSRINRSGETVKWRAVL